MVACIGSLGNLFLARRFLCIYENSNDLNLPFWMHGEQVR